MSWDRLADWWLEEITTDEAYKEVVNPLLLEVLQPEFGDRYIDLGCGEGRVLRELEAIGAEAVGVDLNETLLKQSRSAALVARLPEIPVAADSVDGAYSVLVLEHLEDHGLFFSEAARVIKPHGKLAVVMNHPIWTAPDSTPVTDIDGEVLWRPGDYFSRGLSEVHAGDLTITFHHRTLAELLSAAFRAGWILAKMIERPHHEIEDQSGIPRLLACRWELS